jgi:putative xylitol transport system permease protein
MSAPSITATGIDRSHLTTIKQAKHLIGDYGLFFIFVTVVIALSLATDSFMTSTNLINILRQSSIIGLVSVGMTFVIITGGIDLSVGSVVGFAGVVAASLAPGDSNAFLLPIAAGVGVGLLVGLVNSALIVKAYILPFLATLAVLAAARGTSLIITNGQPLSELSKPFVFLGAGSVGFLPIPVILFIAVAIAADHILMRTRFGRHVYAVGGNTEAARIVGIPVRRVVMTTYLIAGALAGFAAVILTARVNGADPLAGSGYELKVIAAVVIGGTSLFGGIGTIRGTTLGVLLLGVVQNGLDLLNVSSYYQEMIQGVILVLAVLLNRLKPDG